MEKEKAVAAISLIIFVITFAALVQLQISSHTPYRYKVPVYMFETRTLILMPNSTKSRTIYHNYIVRQGRVIDDFGVSHEISPYEIIVLNFTKKSTTNRPIITDFISTVPIFNSTPEQMYHLFENISAQGIKCDYRIKNNHFYIRIDLIRTIQVNTTVLFGIKNGTIANVTMHEIFERDFKYENNTLFVYDALSYVMWLYEDMYLIQIEEISFDSIYFLIYEEG